MVRPAATSRMSGSIRLIAAGNWYWFLWLQMSSEAMQALKTEVGARRL